MLSKNNTEKVLVTNIPMYIDETQKPIKIFEDQN